MQEDIIDDLISFLQSRIVMCENNAEEYIQELDNEEAVKDELSKVTAFKEVLDFIRK